jgi:hypothetical protein
VSSQATNSEQSSTTGVSTNSKLLLKKNLTFGFGKNIMSVWQKQIFSKKEQKIS